MKEKLLREICVSRKGMEGHMELGILTLLPPLVILVIAIKSRSTSSSLFIGAIV